MPAYVILDHDHPQQHWDFMLEDGATLATWRLAIPPQAGQTIAAEPSFPHRRAYLDYEGPVSGDRGTVVRWDRGEYVALAETDGRIEVLLRGSRIAGRATLSRNPEGTDWTFYLTASASVGSS